MKCMKGIFTRRFLWIFQTVWQTVLALSAVKFHISQLLSLYHSFLTETNKFLPVRRAPPKTTKIYHPSISVFSINLWSNPDSAYNSLKTKFEIDWNFSHSFEWHVFIWWLWIHPIKKSGIQDHLNHLNVLIFTSQVYY